MLQSDCPGSKHVLVRPNVHSGSIARAREYIYRIYTCVHAQHLQSFTTCSDRLFLPSLHKVWLSTVILLSYTAHGMKFLHCPGQFVPTSGQGEMLIYHDVSRLLTHNYLYSLHLLSSETLQNCLGEGLLHRLMHRSGQSLPMLPIAFCYVLAAAQTHTHRQLFTTVLHCRLQPA